MPVEISYLRIREYSDTLVPDRPEHLKEMEEIAREKRFPIIGPSAGYFCYQVARMINAKKIFELGSGYGYSTAWFARAVRENGGGVVHHTVWDEDLSNDAKYHLGELGLFDIVEFHVSEAVSALKETDDTFDIIFNDIDKEGYPDSLPVIEKKLRSGGVLIIDNMIWRGRVFDDPDGHESTKGIIEFTRLITTSPNWIASLIPIRDGLILGVKK